MLNPTSQTWNQEVVASPIPVLVDFYAPWCKPCKALAPILDALEKEYAGRVKFAKVNADEESTLANDCGVQGLPTLVIIHNSDMKWRHSGAITAVELRKVIDAVL